MSQRVEINIVLGENGDVVVSGPLSAKVLCYGMLEAAKQVVSSYQTEGTSIVVPPPPPLLLRN